MTGVVVQPAVGRARVHRRRLRPLECSRRQPAQTPPRSSSCRRCWRGPAYRPGRVPVNQLGRAAMLRHGVGKDQPGIDHKPKWMRPAWLRRNLYRALLLSGGGFSFQKHYPRSTGALSSLSTLPRHALHRRIALWKLRYPAARRKQTILNHGFLFSEMFPAFAIYPVGGVPPQQRRVLHQLPLSLRQSDEVS